MANDLYESILEELGYKLSHEFGDYWRMSPLYRESSTETSLSVNKETGWFKDFGANLCGPFERLVALTLRTDDGNAQTYLDKRGYSEAIEFDVPKIEPPTYPTYFDKRDLDHFKQSNLGFYTNKPRNISRDTLTAFKCGFCDKKPMKNRLVFPIMDEKQRICAWSGRHIYWDLLEEKWKKTTPKWKHMGNHKTCSYPLFLTKPYIKESKEVILVESIGDGMALWDAGIRNFLILLGLKLSSKNISSILALQPKRIVVALNNDENKKNAGNNAAYKIQLLLEQFWSKKNIKILFPLKNDFGVMNKLEIKMWENKKKLCFS